MQTEVAQTIFEKVKTLPLQSQEEVLEFIEEKLSSANSATSSQKKDSRPIWEVIDERVSKLSAETLEKLPVDGAENHDHYLYGAPKKAK